MADTATIDSAPETIEADIPYAIDTGETPVNETMGPGDMSRRKTGKYVPQRMTLHNGRRAGDAVGLETHGFTLVSHPTKMKDFFDDDEIKRVYEPEVEELVKAQTGAYRVFVFDHTRRSGDEGTRQERLVREPVQAAHNDYTDWSGPQRVRDLLPDEAEELLKHRFAIVQVWRAINQPIESDPLAMCDSRGLKMDDLIVSERRYPNRVGQTYQVQHNPDHEWYWFPRMARDEALVFKVFDSAKDGRSRFVAHTSFTDPTSPPNARPRESMETRTIAFFKD
jgi:hypothetical protein